MPRYQTPLQLKTLIRKILLNINPNKPVKVLDTEQEAKIKEWLLKEED